MREWGGFAGACVGVWVPGGGGQTDLVYEQVDGVQAELAKEVHNGRLCRLMVKLNMILERQEPGNPSAPDSWSETGDRCRSC